MTEDAAAPLAPGNLDPAPYVALADNLPHLVWIAGADGGFAYVNRRWAEYTGQDARDAAGDGWFEVVHPDDLEAVRAAWRAARELDQPIDVEYRIRARDGAYRWHVARGLPFRDRGGAVARWFGTCTDVDDRRRAEDEVRARARHLQLAAEIGAALTGADTLPVQLQCCAESVVAHLDAAFARIWTVDAAGETLELQASAGMYTHLNGPHGRVPVGMYKIGLIAQERAPHLTNDVLGDPRVGDQEWARREGMVAFAGYPLLVRGRLVGVLAMFARRTLAESTLTALASIADEVALAIDRAVVDAERVASLARERAAHERLRGLFEQAPAIICMLRGPEHVIEFANPLYLATIGHRDVLGKPIREAFPVVDTHRSVAVLDRVYQTGEPAFGSESPSQLDRHGDGRREEAYFNFAFLPIHDADGAVEGVFVHAVDVTEQVLARRRVEEQAAEIAGLNADLERRVRERTAALEASNKELESFCYSVSHDLRAPLRSIDGFSLALLEDYGDKLDAEGQDDLRRIRANSQRMGQLIDDLLQLSRLTRADMSRTRVDLSAVARRVVARLREVDAQRDVDVAIQEGLVAHGDPALLEVALTNLLGNAWKFSARRPDARISFSAAERDGEVVYAVADNGAGFDMTYADKLFGAFQRLHAANEFEGTGIGLAIVQRVIHRHGGRVWADAALDRGATFYFTLG